MFYRVNEDIVVDFVDAFLEAVTAYNVKAALSIPYVSRETFKSLTKTYLSWIERSNRFLLNFLCVDYHGSNPIESFLFHNRVLRYARLLESWIREPVLLYGVNVKYSRVASKHEELPARDLASYFAQLDAFGANRRRPPLPEEVVERVGKRRAVERLKVLSRGGYAYISLNKALTGRAVPEREESFLRKLLEEESGRQKLEKTVRCVNAKIIIEEARTLQSLLGEGIERPIGYLFSKRAIQNDGKTKNAEIPGRAV